MIINRSLDIHFYHYIIIPTINRCSLKKSIQSVVNQTIQPTKLIIVSDKKDRGEYAHDICNDFEGKIIVSEIMENHRIKGLSGALNTGIDHILRRCGTAKDIYISFLDDDDSWDEIYLEEIQKKIIKGADIIAGSLMRVDNSNLDGVLKSPPTKIEAEDFLIGNPGIQGSNLTIKLSLLLKAGLFDENLQNCNDRDLCIRICDLHPNYMAAPKAIAHHDAMPHRKRLSTKYSPEKITGLTKFYSKYRWRMTDEEFQKSADRAKALFGWKENNRKIEAVSTHNEELRIDKGKSINLCFGMIIDGSKPQLGMNLLSGIKALRQRPNLAHCCVVILENGPRGGFLRVVQKARELGITTYPIELAWQKKVAASLPIDIKQLEEGKTKTIAIGRTLLQRFVYEVVQLHNSYAWILDDDFRFISDDEIYLDKLLDTISYCQKNNYKVIIGGNSGAPPVPSLSTMRTQTLDIVHFFKGLEKRNLDEKIFTYYENPSIFRENNNEYHYDLTSKQTNILETPLCPSDKEQSVRDVLEQLLPKMKRIFSGEGVTRRIEYTKNKAKFGCKTVSRGGNTLIFDTDLLYNTPNISPECSGRSVRRSDKIWAINITNFKDAPSIFFPLPLEHDRSSLEILNDESKKFTESRKLIDDIIGYSFSRAYEEITQNKEGLFEHGFSDHHREEIKRRTHKYAKERLAAFRLSFWRCKGLCEIIEHILYEKPQWLLKIPCESLHNINLFLDNLKETTNFANLKHIEESIMIEVKVLDISNFLAQMQKIIQNKYRPDCKYYSKWLQKSRFDNACDLVGVRTQNTDCLGLSSEDVAIKNGKYAYKVFDVISINESARIKKNLLFISRLKDQKIFPKIISVEHYNNILACKYIYEPSKPYQGGHGRALLSLLRELKAAGLVYKDFKPSNMVVSDNGIRITNIGASIIDYNAKEEKFATQKAYLYWKSHSPPNPLPQLSKSVTPDSLPELENWRSLYAAVCGQYIDSKFQLDKTIEELVNIKTTNKLLDYGCGIPRNVHFKYDSNKLTAYDNDLSLKKMWSNNDLSANFITDKCTLLDKKNEHYFEIILCSLVLCAVDDEQVLDILNDILYLANVDAQILIAICDPRSICVKNTAIQERHISKENRYQDFFEYDKTIQSSNKKRREYHRPLEYIRLIMGDVGLQIINETSIKGFDVDRFCPVSEFLVLEAKPISTI